MEVLLLTNNRSTDRVHLCELVCHLVVYAQTSAAGTKVQ